MKGNGEHLLWNVIGIWRAKCAEEHAWYMQFEARDIKHDTCNMEPVTWTLAHGTWMWDQICTTELETLVTGLETRDMERETWYLGLETWDLSKGPDSFERRRPGNAQGFLSAAGPEYFVATYAQGNYSVPQA